MLNTAKRIQSLQASSPRHNRNRSVESGRGRSRGGDSAMTYFGGGSAPQVLAYLEPGAMNMNAIWQVFSSDAT